MGFSILRLLILCTPRTARLISAGGVSQKMTHSRLDWWGEKKRDEKSGARKQPGWMDTTTVLDDGPLLAMTPNSRKFRRVSVSTRSGAGVRSNPGLMTA